MPTVGRIVHFVQKNPNGAGVIHLAAIIVAVWSATCVNLQVFTDSSNSEGSDFGQVGSNYGQVSVKWMGSVLLDDSEFPQDRTWHWPERN